MRWWMLLLVCALVAPALAKVEIVGVPDAPDEKYDIGWTMSATGAVSGALILDVEVDGGQGYQLRWEKDVLSWQQLGGKPAFAPVTAALKLAPNTPMTLGIKRRPDTIAVLKDHRLLFVAPAPMRGKGKFAFSKTPNNCTISEARYRAVGPTIFGDDFMRQPKSDGSESPLAWLARAQQQWTEDPSWPVAFYKRDNPAENPTDPATGAKLTTQWLLNFYPNVEATTANGFWFIYRGIGPSWVVANPTMVYPTWDRYFVEASVRPEYDSEVGLIAGYQDNKNYLLFVWKPRELVSTRRAARPSSSPWSTASGRCCRRTRRASIPASGTRSASTSAGAPRRCWSTATC